MRNIFRNLVENYIGNTQNPKQKPQNHLEINFGTVVPKNKVETGPSGLHLNLELNLLIKGWTNQTTTNWSIKLNSTPKLPDSLTWSRHLMSNAWDFTQPSIIL